MRVALLAGLLASALIEADAVRPGRKFCPLEQACEKAHSSALGAVGGVSTAVLGIVAFGTFFVLTLLPLRRARTVLRILGGIAASAALLFLVYQAFVLETFCPLCVIADSAALVAGVLAWIGSAPSEGAIGRRTFAGPSASWVIWATSAVAALVVPFGWPRAVEPAWVEAPDVDLAAAEMVSPDPPPADTPRPDPSLAVMPDKTPHVPPDVGTLPAAPSVAGEDEAANAPPPSSSTSPEQQPEPPTSAGADPVSPETSAASEAPSDGPNAEPPVAELPKAEPLSASGNDTAPSSDAPAVPRTEPTPPPATPAATVPPSAPAADALKPASPPAPTPPATVAEPTLPASPAAAAPKTSPAPPAPVTRPEPVVAPKPRAAPPKPAAPAPTAPAVVIVEYLNAFCPHCRATHARLETVLAETRVPVKRYRVYAWATADYPLWARACAFASTVGREDGMFRELMRAPDPSVAQIYAAAERAGVDVRALARALQDPAPPERLVRDRQVGSTARLQMLPTLDIGRRRIMGEATAGELRDALRAAR